jgi:hypothetical protein
MNPSIPSGNVVSYSHLRGQPAQSLMQSICHQADFQTEPQSRNLKPAQRTDPKKASDVNIT